MTDREVPPEGTRGWEGLPLIGKHTAYLAEHAITPEVARAAGLYSVTEAADLPEPFAWAGDAAVPAIVFPWTEPSGAVKLQIKPPVGAVEIDGEPVKYLCEKGNSPRLGLIRSGDNGPALIVEGTKQCLAAAAYAPEGVTVLGITGCWGWMKDGVATSELAVVDGRDVIIALDGDVASNRKVYDAAIKLSEACVVEGAASVKFLRLPAAGKAGLDDVLGARGHDRRAAYLARLIEGAEKKPADRKPDAKAKKSEEGGTDEGAEEEHPFFNANGLMVKKLAQAVFDRHPSAITEESKVALYMNGVYHIDGAAFIGVVAELLEDRFRPGHRDAVEEFTEGTLYRTGRRLPPHISVPMLNVRNGMLDLLTGVLKPHDPSYLSGIQVPIVWDEDAVCPAYDDWTPGVVGDQLADLEEATSTMLDPSRTPSKAVFLFGPSRSGKSTWLRLMAAIAGPANTSAVTLAQLANNRFAAANVYGKMLNSAADLSAAHVEDMSFFKLMTGEDLIPADRKYGKQFSFVNKALFAFSANELPTVGESSRAYIERIKPFKFANSFAGRENPKIEAAMMAELPGILARWVRAYQGLLARGVYLATDAEVRHEFEVRSDRVRQFVDECCIIWPVATAGGELPASQVTPKRDLARIFKRWTEANNTAPMGERKVFDRLTNITGVYEVRAKGTGTRGFNVTAMTAEKWGERPVQDQPAVMPVVITAGTGTFKSETAGETSQVNGQFKDHPAVPAVSDPHNFMRENHTSVGEEGGVCVFGRGRLSPETAGSAGSARKEALTCDDAPAVSDLKLPESAGSPVESAGESAGALTGLMPFDIETADAKQLWRRSDFVRLSGYRNGDGAVHLTTDAAELVAKLVGAERIVGHNILGFDLLALARYHGLDIAALAERDAIVDTYLTARLIDPPSAQGGKSYSLETLADERGWGADKDALDRLKKEFGGYDQIPVDDPRYRQYLTADVELTERLAGEFGPLSDYAKREHKVAAIAAQMSVNGFRVDTELLARRLEAGQVRKAELTKILVEQYGLPTVDAKGKAYKSPQATDAGKFAILKALAKAGVTEDSMPRTPKGDWSLGKEAMDTLAEIYADNPRVCELAEVVKSLNGIRTVYQTISDHLAGDRVHPMIDMRQASGRWSVTDPGLTVLGKRDGKHAERDVLLPEPGHVIICADMSQVDMRAIAAHCQDPAYMELFAPGRDAHSEIAEAVFGDVAFRDEAKKIGHSWNYGARIKSIARSARIGLEVVATFDAGMCESYPDLIAWRDEIRAKAEAGELLDNGFGRLMRPDPERSWTQAPSLMGQGAARDLMMQGLLNLPAEILPMLRALVHDEIVLSVPLELADEVERVVLDALTFEWRGVPILAELGQRRGTSWGHVYDKHDVRVTA